MRLHVVSLPHTETTREYLHCAYTQKIVKFCDMMSRGHEVILYSGEENEARCAEHVPLLSRAERVEWFGEWDTNNLFEKIDWDPASPWWAAMNGRAVIEIGRRCEPHDILCLVTATQSPIARALPALMPVEWAVGYEGIQLHRYPSGTPACRVFESYAWMHYLYGKWNANDGNGFAFDTVIPNFFDPADFNLVRGRHWLRRTARAGGGGYLVFLGRLVQRKGPQIALEIARRVGMPLLIAGPGGHSYGPERLQGCDVELVGPGFEYVGPVGLEARAELLVGAAAVIVPTIYVEPFGGVAVEAMLAGAPVVASDWGAFTETVMPGVSGYRFQTLTEGVQATRDALELDRVKVRDYAVGRYSLDAVYPLFDAHFRRLDTLWGDGWYA